MAGDRDLTFVFDVDFSDHDALKNGVTVTGTSRVVVQSDDLNDASLTALQMSGLGDGVPTDCRLVRVVA